MLDTLFINKINTEEGQEFMVAFSNFDTKKEMMALFTDYKDAINFVKDFLEEGAFDLCRDEIYNNVIEYDLLEEVFVISPEGLSDPAEETVNAWGSQAIVF